MSQTVSEAELVRQARSGNHAAFETLVRPLGEPAYNLAFAILHHRHDAEDAVQEAIVKAWRKLSQLRDSVSFRAWFFKIVANECRMARRGRWRSVVKLPEVRPTAAADGEVSDVTTDLRRELARLPEPDRLIVFLYFVLDLPLEEIADVLDLSPAGAKSRLYRALGR